MYFVIGVEGMSRVAEFRGGKAERMLSILDVKKSRNRLQFASV